MNVDHRHCFSSELHSSYTYLTIFSVDSPIKMMNLAMQYGKLIILFRRRALVGDSIFRFMMYLAEKQFQCVTQKK